MFIKYGFVLVVLLCARSQLTSAKFPEDPAPCKYKDTACILKLINYYLAEKSEGDPAINLVKIDPLAVSEIKINQGEGNPVNIDLTFLDNKIFGFSSGEAYEVKGFGKDLTKSHELRIKMKKVSLIGKYKIKGKILVLPISGSGSSNVTMVNVDTKISFSGTPVEKNGETYMKIENLKMTAEPEQLIYHFDNLFNGDKALGDNMNKFLNENWKAIFDEVKVSLEEAFGSIYQSVIGNVFTKYPYNKFLVE